MKNKPVRIEMKTLQIRLTEKQIKFLHKEVSKGLYPNRSEAIRNYVRHFMHTKEEGDAANGR